MNEELKPPAKSAADTYHMLARAGLSAVPLVGGPAVEVFNAIVMPPIEKRRQIWMERVADALVELRDKFDLLPEILSSNDNFVSVVINATHIALRTHEEEKLAALRNTVRNVALDTNPHTARHHIFLRLIDDLSAPQLELLRVHGATAVGDRAYFLGARKYEGAAWLVNELLDGLTRRGLITLDQRHEMDKEPTYSFSRTELGEQFAAFIFDESSKET